MSAIADFNTAGPELIEATLAERYGKKVGTHPASHELECDNAKDLNAE